MDLHDLHDYAREICNDILRTVSQRIIGDVLARVRTRIEKRTPRQPRFPEKSGSAKWAVNYEDVEWSRLVARLRSEEPRDVDQRLFRRRFRVPFNVFEELLAAAQSSGEFVARSPAGRRRVPLELKLLGVLRYNAVGGIWDVISEASGGVSIDTFSTFHRKYMDWFNRTQLEKYVYPSNPETAAKTYANYGFPGCVGSMDGVHIPWEACPWQMKNLYTGKEGHPTIAFNVVCDSTTRVQSITRAFHGKVNDKTMVRCDEFVSRLRSDREYKRLAFELCEKHGVTKRWLGAYIMCDGGYHQWRETISALKGTSNVDEASFAARLEAVRKDVEALFGRVKKRFRILKVGLLFQEADHVEHTFNFCMALHNRLLREDGYDVLGESDDHWIQKDIHEHVERTKKKLQEAKKLKNISVRHGWHPADADLSYVGPTALDVPVERTADFFELRKALVQHQKVLGVGRWRKTGAALGKGFKR